MADPLDPLFEILEPPAGGLEALHARLHRRSRRRRLAGAAALAAAVLLMLRPSPRPDLDDPTWLAMGGQGEPGAQAQTATTTALQQVSSSDEVLFYRVASQPPPAEEPP